MQSPPSVKIAILAGLAIFAPVKGAALTALALCVVDMLTGLWASRKQGIPVTSNGLKKTVIKIAVYEAAILLTFLVDAFLAGTFPLSNIVSGLIGLTEAKSCLENINIIAGGNPLAGIIRAIGSQSSNNPPDEAP
jgi:hypothetical protein